MKEVDRIRMRKMRIVGMSYKAIAVEIGCSATTVARYTNDIRKEDMERNELTTEEVYQKIKSDSKKMWKYRTPNKKKLRKQVKKGFKDIQPKKITLQMVIDDMGRIDSKQKFMKKQIDDLQQRLRDMEFDKEENEERILKIEKYCFKTWKGENRKRPKKSFFKRIFR